MKVSIIMVLQFSACFKGFPYLEYETVCSMGDDSAVDVYIVSWSHRRARGIRIVQEC